jgi:hypothetical protein
MKKIAVIGATGKLGKELMKHEDAIECPIRFQNSDEFVTWFDTHRGDRYCLACREGL